MSFLHAYNIFVQSVVSTEHVVDEKNNTLVIIDRTDAIDDRQFLRQQLQNVYPKNYFSDETIRDWMAFLESEGSYDARTHNFLKALPNHPTALNAFKHIDGIEFRANLLTHSPKYGNVFLAENDLDGKAPTIYFVIDSYFTKLYIQPYAWRDSGLQLTLTYFIRIA